MITHGSTYFELHRPDARITFETHCARRLSGRARIANFIRCLVNYIYIGLTLQDPPVSRLAEPWTAYHVLTEVQNSLGMAFTYLVEMRSRPKWNAFACSIEIFAFTCSLKLICIRVLHSIAFVCSIKIFCIHTKLNWKHFAFACISTWSLVAPLLAQMSVSIDQGSKRPSGWFVWQHTVAVVLVQGKNL